MDTVFLSEVMPKGRPGRPARFGSFAYNEHRMGSFIGYLTVKGEPYKVAVGWRYFEDMLPSLEDGQYLVSVNVREIHEKGIANKLRGLFRPRIVDKSRLLEEGQ